jgi:hypothetical protein
MGIEGYSKEEIDMWEYSCKLTGFDRKLGDINPLEYSMIKGYLYILMYFCDDLGISISDIFGDLLLPLLAYSLLSKNTECFLYLYENHQYLFNSS